MAGPTETEVQTQIENAVKYLDERDADLRETASTNHSALLDAIVEGTESDYAAEINAGVDRLRAAGSALVSVESIRSLLDPLMLTYAKQQGFPETDPVEIAQRLYVDFAERGTPETVQERNFTFATPSAGGSNVGGGTLHRLNTDAYGYDIEAQNPEAKEARCIADKHSGANEHQEVFELRAAFTPRDLVAGFLVAGQARTGQIQSLSADDSLVANPTFGQDDASAAPSSITNWTVSSGVIGDFEIVDTAANTYRTAQSEGGGTSSPDPKALKITASAGVEQSFNVNGIDLDPGTPYFAQVAINKTVGTAVGGTVTLTVGAATASVTIAAAGANWHVLNLALGQDNWHRTIMSADPKVDVSWASATSGYLLVDDIILSPMTQFGGGWYALVGNDTVFQRDDIFTWTDTAVGAKTQEWIARAYGLYLPSSATPTWSDPA